MPTQHGLKDSLEITSRLFANIDAVNKSDKVGINSRTPLSVLFFFQAGIPGAEAVWVYSLRIVSHCKHTVSSFDFKLGQFQGQFVDDSSVGKSCVL